MSADDATGGTHSTSSMPHESSLDPPCADGLARRPRVTPEESTSDDLPVADVVAQIAELAAGLGRSPSVETVLERALAVAVEIVPGCEQAGISLLVEGKVDTPASLGPLAEQCDLIQEQSGEGPCVSALLDADVVRIDTVADDPRWPSFSAHAAEAGLGSMLACRLATQRDKLGALNMYSTRAGAFSEESEALAVGYAAHVSYALAALDREENLRRAMQSREVIGQAMGILMERHRITAGQAFDVMVHASQHGNVKLRLVAEELVRTGILPGSSAE